MTALKFHRWTAVLLVAFILLHFATHLSGLWGIEAYNSTQDLLRQIYRNQVIEPVLLLAVVVQIGLGAQLLLRRFRRGPLKGWARIQMVSGAILAVFLAQHLSALALARWVGGLDTDFYWPASVMRGSPFLWYFAPYYFAGVTALFVHLGCAARLMLLRNGRNRDAAIVFWCLAIPGVGIAAVINLMLLGAFYEIVLPDIWVVYLRTFVPGYGL